MDATDYLAEKLLENPQFMMVLRDTVGNMVEQTTIEKRHSAERPYVNSLIEELYGIIKEAVHNTIKAEINMFTETLFNTITSMKNDIDSHKALVEQSCQAYIIKLSSEYSKAIKGIKSDIMADKLRLDKKFTTTKESIESLTTKIKLIEAAQNCFNDVSSTMNIENSKALDNSTSIKKELANEDSIERNGGKAVNHLEDSLCLLETQQDKFYATIEGLWKVVGEIMKRLYNCEDKQRESEEQLEKKTVQRPVRASIWGFK